MKIKGEKKIRTLTFNISLAVEDNGGFPWSVAWITIVTRPFLLGVSECFNGRWSRTSPVPESMTIALGSSNSLDKIL